MLLESIKLVNFRQFLNDSINFADGKNGKNVTIIIGDNGTGKTTFAQAFFWCLYGETEFADKNMLNKKVAIELRPGQATKVKVELKLKHGDAQYTLIRGQEYKREQSGKLSVANAVFDIAKKDGNGNTSYVKKTQCESEVKNILSKELSRYFFFDGERIEKMSKDISTGKKATDFAEAVKGLLGLNSMISAIQHFNPKSKYGVIGSYENSFDSTSNSRIQEYSKTIENCNKKLEEIDSRIEELNSEIIEATNRKNDKSEEIKQYTDGEKLQRQREALLEKIKNVQNSKFSLYKAICISFNNGMSSFFSISLIKRTLEMLDKEDFTGKDIPFMHGKTIEYLLKQGVCICGTHLDEGSVPYNKVKALIEFLPPQSISSSIGDFNREARTRAGKNTDLTQELEDNYKIISQQNDDILEFTDELATIDQKLSGNDVREKVRTINNEINFCKKIIQDKNNERDRKIQEQGRLKGELERADTERRNLTLLDDNNKKIEIYKMYAETIYEELLTVYTEEESKIRNKLQTTINDIFIHIYEGGLYLTIDDKYHISVSATDYEGDVETSTAQSISVIFAFITGIIKLARENRNNLDENAKLLTSEPYPLVMDAPLSTFDKRRIKTVCTALPNVAEQVIIFIKDTDGTLAEEYMGDKIGCKHYFEKKNEFETSLV